MATCEDCGQEMTTAAGCTIDRLLINGESWSRMRMPRSGRRAMRCHDCGVRPGNYHHLGCDMERCPRCGSQLLMCSCPPAPGSDPLNGVATILPDLRHHVDVQP